MVITFLVLLFELSVVGAVSVAELLETGFEFIEPVDEDVWSYGHD